MYLAPLYCFVCNLLYVCPKSCSTDRVSFECQLFVSLNSFDYFLCNVICLLHFLPSPLLDA